MRLFPSSRFALPASLFALLFLAGCTGDALVEPNAADVQAVQLRPGIHQETLSLGKGGVLRYTVSVPLTLQSGRKVPLVLALHHAGLVTPFFAEGYLRAQVEPALNDLHAIIVAPDVPAASWIDPLSEEAVLALLFLAVEHWPVDPDRIVITGYSMGGIGTWYLAGRHPDLFSAAIPVAADAAYGALDGAARVPFYVIHGGHDETFDVQDVRDVVAALEARNAPVRLVVVDDLSHNARSSYAAPLHDAVAWLEDEVWR